MPINKEKQKQRTRRYYEANAETIKERKRQQYDPDARRAYLEANRERLKEARAANKAAAVRHEFEAMAYSYYNRKGETLAPFFRYFLSTPERISTLTPKHLQAVHTIIQLLPSEETNYIVPPPAIEMSVTDRLAKISEPTIYAEPNF